MASKGPPRWPIRLPRWPARPSTDPPRRSTWSRIVYTKLGQYKDDFRYRLHGFQSVAKVENVPPMPSAIQSQEKQCDARQLMRDLLPTIFHHHADRRPRSLHRQVSCQTGHVTNCTLQGLLKGVTASPPSKKQHRRLTAQCPPSPTRALWPSRQPPSTNSLRTWPTPPPPQSSSSWPHPSAAGPPSPLPRPSVWMQRLT